MEGDSPVGPAAGEVAAATPGYGGSTSGSFGSGDDGGMSGATGMEILEEGTTAGRDRVKGPWSPEEDAILSRLVSKFGARNWSLIARGIAGRSGKSCRLRWCNQLDPAVKRRPFTGVAYQAGSYGTYNLDSSFLIELCRVGLSG